MRSLRNHGISKSLIERNKSLLTYNILQPGLNYRIDDLRASLGISQITKLKKNNLKRKKLAERYKSLIKKNDINIKIPFKEKIGLNYSYHLFPIILPREIDRSYFIKFFKERGIQLSFHYFPIHKFKIFKKYGKNLSFTDDISEKLVSLPLHANLNYDQQNYILQVLNLFFKRN
jgi:dTDP-4-amino-4,6-dideoxygalactose transaminase